jgi:hypothetical protein
MDNVAHEERLQQHYCCAKGYPRPAGCENQTLPWITLITLIAENQRQELTADLRGCSRIKNPPRKDAQAAAITQKNQPLLRDNSDRTDLHGPKKFKSVNPRHLGASVCILDEICF